ncbi:MAG TPA: aquaporin [Gemmatimonadales bacterium]|nr:aquaporin [Gemmatimonadales bacterium]
MNDLPRRAVAEAIGTFALIFFGCGASLLSSVPGAAFGLLGVALVHAIVLGVMITATMSISGGHLNPAVTLGLLSTGRIDARGAGIYVVAQLLGAVLGAWLLTLLLPVGIAKNMGPSATPVLMNNLGLVQGIAWEAVLTFFLVSAVYGTAVAANAPKVGGFGIGLVLFFDIMVGGPMTGAAMNPARAFAPALVGGNWFGQMVWWIGPIAGGVIAAQLWDRFLLKGR